MIENNRIVDQDIAFSERLRHSTSHAHKKLEVLPVSLAIVSPAITIKEYGHYLLLMNSIWDEMESLVFPMLESTISDLQDRKKCHLIDDDLVYIKSGNGKFQKIFNYETLTIPFALGMLYVTEGSILGGRFILKNMVALGINGEQGATYFAGYGNETGAFWKSFLNQMSAYEKQHHCGIHIIAGANFAFASIYNHFLNTASNEN